VTTAQTPCGSTEACDFPTTRDLYTATPNQVLKIFWLVFNCTTWKDQAETKISHATYDLNLKYASVGYQFNSYLNFYPCTGTDGSQDYSSFPSDGNKVVNAVVKEKGSNFRSQGGFQIVAGTPTDSTLNGFMFLPNTGATYAGVGFMNTGVVASGFTTLSHELGHAFGLQHTFVGVSETNAACSCAEATASDITGDFCSDTPPIAKNWECTSPISTTTFPDKCTARGAQWVNPYTNLMSYGTCRTLFTAQQTRRIRCYRERNLGWVVVDTNPLRNYTAGPPGNTEPVPPPGAAGSYILSFMTMLAALFALV
jgi:hypothetical protein